MTFVYQQANLLEQKSTTIEGLSALVKEQEMANKWQSDLIQLEMNTEPKCRWILYFFITEESFNIRKGIWYGLLYHTIRYIDDLFFSQRLEEEIE